MADETFQIRAAERKKAKIRMGLSGPSGSGKTYSALLVAFGITDSWEDIVLIDTENRSADLYAHLGAFKVLPLDAPYSPERYIGAIKTCEKAGFKVIIIDSITHEWDGKGGCLEIHEQLGGKYQTWAEVTPRHRKFIDTILQSPCHIITTVRAKTDYAMTNENGKVKVEKAGLKEVTREGFEYELTVNLQIDMNHNARVSAGKDRTGLFVDKPTAPLSKETGERIREWCESGVNALEKVKEAIKNAKTEAELKSVDVSDLTDSEKQIARTEYRARQAELGIDTSKGKSK